jgi:hypothetical protein
MNDAPPRTTRRAGGSPAAPRRVAGPVDGSGR